MDQDKELELLPFTDKFLYSPPADVDCENENLPLLKNTLLLAMNKFGGVGLSANQVGLDMKYFVIGDNQPDGMQKAFFNSEGEEMIETYKGVTARVILHEYDHMIGQNFTMRVSKLKLERALKALKKKVKKHQRQEAQTL